MEALSTGIKKMERILKMVDDEKHGDWTHWSSLTAAGFVCVSGSQSGMILPPRGQCQEWEIRQFIRVSSNKNVDHTDIEINRGKMKMDQSAIYERRKLWRKS